jgi:8-oxo-dGTP diphosphatase
MYRLGQRQSQGRKFAPMKRVVAALICKDGKILVCQRTRHQTMPLKWEFPGGKIEEGEQPRDAMHRELEEELGIDATVGDEVTRMRHEYPNGASVELRFFVVREYAGELENRIFRDIQWANPPDLPSYDFLEADRKLVEDLAAGKIL